MGLQFTQWGFKNVKYVPLVSAEGGVGRGLEPITEMKGIDGGSPWTSYASVATFLTTKQRAFICENTEYGRASFVNDKINLRFWRAKGFKGYLISGDNPLDLSQKISKAVGTMQPLPSWT